MKQTLSFLDDPKSKWGRRVDYFIQFLILVSLVDFSIATLPTLSESERELLEAIESLIVIIFSIEYVVRIILSHKRLGYIFSFYGLIDICAILPFYIAVGIDLRSLRAFRFLRLFRVLKIVRYSKAITRMKHALIIAKEELVLFFFATMLLLYISAVGIYYFENSEQPEVFSSVFDGLWWAVATLTTVGYGDVYPITVGGKVFTFIILMIGLGIVAIPTGLLASALSKARDMERK